jgi:hypothetical protein
MITSRLFALPLLAFLLAAVPATPPAASPDGPAKANRPAMQEFMRFIDEGPHPRLETSVITLTHPDGRTIDLVSMVHVADASYYAAINDLAKSYDSALYELVKAEGAAPPKPGQKATSGVGMMQRFMESVLKLEYQLDGIDYTPKNFVHADLTAEQFFHLQDQRGESLSGLMIQSMLREMGKAQNANQQAAIMNEFFAAANNPDKARFLKRGLARSFDQIESALAGLEGGEKGSVLVTERNKAALAALAKQTAGGQKSFGLLYGAAHMPDFYSRLTAMGYKQTAARWLTAWDLTPAPTTQPATP